ncbi:DUF397 domain-containing protein [Spongiactinospora rosea]|uniref:DUF397 domain-containing protein n=1 Tax=Spongiactinospora rosea TaxID=2248750 RepID=A0A366M198_9ACTN|nr:DUF397 domain-containing protein [Spongiactinospora rosea]RBQ19988.1 DUF397 domain-containing protein [Spongiactinospora rosea]
MDLTTAHWRKSTRSSGTGDDCVEVALLPGAVAVRDSKDPGGPSLLFTPGEWAAFVRAIRRGRAQT